MQIFNSKANSAVSWKPSFNFVSMWMTLNLENQSPSVLQHIHNEKGTCMSLLFCPYRKLPWQQSWHGSAFICSQCTSALVPLWEQWLLGSNNNLVQYFFMFKLVYGLFKNELDFSKSRSRITQNNCTFQCTSVYQGNSFFIHSLFLDMSNKMIFLSVAVKENK